MNRLATKRLVLLALGGAIAFAGDQLAFGGHALRPPHLDTLAGLHAATASSPRRAALLINGGYSPSKNHRRYWNNLSLMQMGLRHQGWGEIIVLDGDGTDPTPDRIVRSAFGMFATGSPVDSPIDLDEDGTPDVDGPATKAAVRAALQSLGASAQAGDELFVFLTDHGQLRWDGGVSATAMLWDGELSGREFAAELDTAIPADVSLTVVAAQCHGARFLGPVARPGTTLIAPGYPLWVGSTPHYGVFPYHFAAALLATDPESGRPIASDLDADGLVSFAEAFDWATAHDHAPEWPQMWTTPTDALPTAIADGAASKR